VSVAKEMCFQRSSEGIEVPATAVRVEDRSAVEDRLPRNSCHQICCVFVPSRSAFVVGWALN